MAMAHAGWLLSGAVAAVARTATSRRVLWVVGNGWGVAVECGRR